MIEGFLVCIYHNGVLTFQRDDLAAGILQSVGYLFGIEIVQIQDVAFLTDFFGDVLLGSHHEGVAGNNAVRKAGCSGNQGNRSFDGHFFDVDRDALFIALILVTRLFHSQHYVGSGKPGQGVQH